MLELFAFVGLPYAAILTCIVGTVWPGLFPTTMRGHDGSVAVYFEAAAVITVLVLLGQVLELRELHLELALARLRALREDLEDQLGAVHHSPRDHFLDVALLGGRQVVIDDHDLGLCARHQVAQLFGLALAEESRDVRALTLAGEHGTGIGVSGVHEQA